ncbi:MAG: hypothetical protein IJ837_02140 [Clostridia bacterium]|nr:hypothetical protein [Clostridia bacterium]
MNINKKTYKYAKQLQDEVGLSIENIKNTSSQNYANQSSQISTLSQNISTINQTISNIQTTHSNDISNLNSSLAEVNSLSEKISNKTTTLSSLNTNSEYPSAKCVYDAINNLGGDYNEPNFNTTYIKASQQDFLGKIKYFQIGKMVVVNFNNIYFNAQNFSNNEIFASNLPSSKKEVVANIFGSLGTTISIKICENESQIKSNCSLLPNEFEAFCGYLIYLTQ